MKKQHILTDHASLRMAQRGISDPQVNDTIRYGKKIYRQGLVFHIMRDKDIPDGFSAKQRGQLKRMVVVTAGDGTGTVITVYRSSKALKNIRCKSKMLR